MNALRVKKVAFTIGTPLIEPPGIEGLVLYFPRLEGVIMTNFHFLRNHVQPDALHPRSGATEILIDDLPV